MSELAAEGLVCDARFAEAFVRARVERGSGPLRIRRDLEARGVEAEAVERFLARDGDEEWIARARRVRDKRFGAPPPPPAETPRQARFLAGRGFTRRQVREALREALRERGESELP